MKNFIKIIALILALCALALAITAIAKPSLFDNNKKDDVIEVPNDDPETPEEPEEPEKPDELEYATNIVDYEIEGDTITAYTGADKYIKIPTSYSISGTEEVKLSFENQFDLTDYIMLNHDTINYPITVTDSESQDYEFFSEFEIIENEEMLYPVSITIVKNIYTEGNDYQITKIDMDILSDSLVEYVIVPNGITEVDASFRRCDTLKEIQLPETVTKIGSQTFLNCGNLVAINVDENNENYLSEDGVLFNKDKTKLEYFPAGKGGTYTIPNTVTEIQSLAFYQCGNLENIYFESGINLETIPGQAFAYCTKLTSIEIPASVTYLDYQAFNNCSNLVAVSFEEASLLEGFGNLVFSSCPLLETITIPASVRSLGNSCFGTIKTIIIESTTPPTFGVVSPFSSTIEAIYVPESAVDTYKTADGWSEFAEKIVGFYNVTYSEEDLSNYQGITKYLISASEGGTFNSLVKCIYMSNGGVYILSDCTSKTGENYLYQIKCVIDPNLEGLTLSSLIDKLKSSAVDTEVIIY